MEGAYIIEVNNLVIPTTSKSNEKKTEFPLIQRIRRLPRDAGNDIYKPRVVSIGPYHRKSDGTLVMEKAKWESFGYILGLNPEKKMRDYLEAMAGWEQRIRSCYANAIETESDELLKMVLLDGSFILCLLYGNEESAQPILDFGMSRTTVERDPELEQNINEPEFSNNGYDNRQQISSNKDHDDDSFEDKDITKQWYTSFFTQDLLLLENQIPFFVVVKIFELVTNNTRSVTILQENVARFMEDLLQSYPKAIQFDQPNELHHLLHLCHLYFKPNQVHYSKNPNISVSCDDEASTTTAGHQLLGWHQASEYHRTGIEFKKREFFIENPHSLLDVGFCNGVMELPCLTIDPNTYCLLGNLLAFEETCPEIGNYITTYVVFLSQFVGMPEDVSLLTKRGIIVHQLDSDVAVSNIFKMLAEGVTFDINSDYYLKHVCHEMELHCEMQRPRWSEWLDSTSSKLPVWPHESKSNQSFRRSSPEEYV